jgi:hypothetical protein
MCYCGKPSRTNHPRNVQHKRNTDRRKMVDQKIKESFGKVEMRSVARKRKTEILKRLGKL